MNGRPAAGLVLVISLAAGPGSAEDLVFADPWIAEPPPAAGAAAGYVAIRNGDSEADTLLSARASFAGRTDVHVTTTDADGIMRMRPAADGLEVAPGGTLVLEPGGNHLMFTGLEGPLAAGEHREVELVFAGAGIVTVEFGIRKRSHGNADHAGGEPE